MLVTSLTDFIAFIANCFSPIYAVRSFGVFVALLVAINYILVMTAR